MTGEPLRCGFTRQDVLYEFYPSVGELVMISERVEKSFDMKDVFFFHGWLGSAIMHYMEDVKSGKGNIVKR